MNRNEVRKNVFQVVFQVEFRQKEEFPELAELFLSNQGITSEKAINEIIEKSMGILTHVQDLDVVLDDLLVGWKKDRLGKAELAILRLALYEIIYEKETIPVAVAINEAVELAKEFCDDKASGMVNAVLSKYVKQE